MTRYASWFAAAVSVLAASACGSSDGETTAAPRPGDSCEGGRIECGSVSGSTDPSASRRHLSGRARRMNVVIDRQRVGTTGWQPGAGGADR